MTQEQAQSLFDALAAQRISAVLSFSYHDRMLPAENYQVSVPLGPGALRPNELDRILDAAAMHNCEAHIIGGSVLLMPA